MLFSWWLAAILTCKSFVILRKRCQRLQLVEEREEREEKEKKNKKRKRKKIKREEEKNEHFSKKITKAQKPPDGIIRHCEIFSSPVPSLALCVGSNDQCDGNQCCPSFGGSLRRHHQEWSLRLDSSFLIPGVVLRGHSQLVESFVWLVPPVRIDRLIALSLSWCKAVLASWSQLSGYSRFRVHFEKEERRQKKKTREKKSKRLKKERENERTREQVFVKRQKKRKRESIEKKRNHKAQKIHRTNCHIMIRKKTLQELIIWHFFFESSESHRVSN